jgi:monoamine oxidase
MLTVFLGGKDSVASGAGSPEETAQGFLPAIDAIWSGAADRYRQGSAVRMYWPDAPFALGSYACYLPGQAAWSGTEREPVGRVHFCGEHTSEDFQGYMEGAAESGGRAAQEVLDALSSAASMQLLGSRA